MRKRQRGASLIETMIAVGILGAIAYFVTGMIRNGTMGQRALQSSDDARTMTDNMAAILADPIACGNTFAPATIATYDPTKPAGDSITKIMDGSTTPAGGQIAYQVGNKYSTKALVLDSITVGGSGTDAKSGIVKWTPLSSGLGGTAFVQVVWSQANPAQNGGSPQKISKFFLLNALTMSGTKIQSCQAQASGGGGNGLWTKIGSGDIYNNNPGGVGINTQLPVSGSLLDVFSNTTSAHSLLVDSAGRVGVGVSASSLPLQAPLQVEASSGILIVASKSNGSGSVIRLDGKNSAGTGRSFSMGEGLGGTPGSDFTIYDNDNAKARLVVLSGGLPTAGFVGIGTTTPGYQLDVAGDVQATSFISTSDERLKTDIRPVEGLSKILALRGVRFRWIKDGAASVGLIAQEVEKVFPELVSTSITTGLKAVRYDALVGPIIEAVKELYAMVQALDQRLKALEVSNARKDTAISELQRRLDAQDREISDLVKKMEGR